MVNRLVLNLSRAVNVRGETFQTMSGNPEPVFAANSILGNIGAPLNIEDENVEWLPEVDYQTVEIVSHDIEKIGSDSA